MAAQPIRCLDPLATILLSNKSRSRVHLTRGLSSLRWEWPVPDGDGEVPWGALAGPDDEETNLLAHQ